MDTGIRVLWLLHRGPTYSYDHLSVGRYFINGQMGKAIIFSMYSFIFNCCAQMGRQLYSWHSRSSPIAMWFVTSHLSDSHQPNHFSSFPSSFSPFIQPRPCSSKSTFSLGSSSGPPATKEKTSSSPKKNGLSCSRRPTPKRRLGISPRTPEWHRLARYSRAGIWSRQFGYHCRERFT